MSFEEAHRIAQDIKANVAEALDHPSDFQAMKNLQRDAQGLRGKPELQNQVRAALELVSYRILPPISIENDGTINTSKVVSEHQLSNGNPTQLTRELNASSNRWSNLLYVIDSVGGKHKVPGQPSWRD